MPEGVEKRAVKKQVKFMAKIFGVAAYLISFQMVFPLNFVILMYKSP